jgi:hypothetical protein
MLETRARWAALVRVMDVTPLTRWGCGQPRKRLFFVSASSGALPAVASSSYYFRMSMTESRSSSVSVSWRLKQIHVPTKFARLHIAGVLQTPQRGLAGIAWKPLG